jgi:hypothetical protein
VVSWHISISSPPGTTSPSVLPHPSAVAVVWIPGLNSNAACKAVLTRGYAHIASTLARDIDGARVLPNANTYLWPEDDGRAPASLSCTPMRPRIGSTLT